MAFWFLVVAALVLGCGGSATAEVSLSEAERRVLQEVEDVMAADPCGAENAHACEYSEAKFSRANTPPAEGESSIMIIDSAMTVASLALHEGRIVAHFRHASEPEYFVPFQPRNNFPKAMLEILHRKFRQRENLAAAKGAGEVGKRFMAKYRGLHGKGDVQGHGTTSLNLLAELNPGTKIVAVHVDSAFHQPPICRLAEYYGEYALQRYWDERADALARIAQEYRVKWVNYSMGWDLRAAKQAWSDQRCWGRMPSDDKFRKFVAQSNAIVKKLTAIPGLLFVQAAPYPDRYLDAQAQKDFVADCERVPGRLRVGYLNLESATLTVDEARDTRLLSEDMRKAAPCTDLFVRDGLVDYLVPSETPIHFTVTGFGHAPLNVPGTSYTAPLGLSYAAYLMSTNQWEADRVVREIRGEWQEPLLVAPFHSRSFLNQNRDYLNFN